MSNQYCCEQIDDSSNKWRSCQKCEDVKLLCNQITNQSWCESTQNGTNKYCQWQNNQCVNKPFSPQFAKSITPCTNQFSDNYVCLGNIQNNNQSNNNQSNNNQSNNQSNTNQNPSNVNSNQLYYNGYVQFYNPNYNGNNLTSIKSNQYSTWSIILTIVVALVIIYILYILYKKSKHNN